MCLWRPDASGEPAVARNDATLPADLPEAVAVPLDTHGRRQARNPLDDRPAGITARKRGHATRRGDWNDHSLRVTAGILIGTLPIAVAGLALRRTLEGCGSPLRSILVVGWACVVMGVLLALAERYGIFKGCRRAIFLVRPMLCPAVLLSVRPRLTGQPFPREAA